jgi:hypothetical protein
MVQDLGLEYVGTIRTMAHWDSKKSSPGGLNGDGMTSALSSIHFLSGVAEATDWNWVPILSVLRLFHKLCKKWAMAGTWNKASVFSFAHLRITGRCAKLSAQAPLLRSLSSLTSPELWKRRARFLAQQQIQKPSLYFSVPIMTLHALRTLPLQKLVHVRNVSKNLMQHCGYLGSLTDV